MYEYQDNEVHFKNGPSDCRFRVEPAIQADFFLPGRRKIVEITHHMTVRENAEKS